MQNDDDDERKKNVLPDLIIPLLALGFTLYYFTTIADVPWIAQASALTVGLLLIAAIVAFAARTWARVARGHSELKLPALGDRLLLTRRLGLLLLTVSYVAAIETLGFTLTTFLFLFMSVVLLSSPRNWRAALAVALTCSAGGYLLFIVLFKTRFPLGVVEHFLSGLVTGGG